MRAPNRGRQRACSVCSVVAAAGAACGLVSRSAPSIKSGVGNGWHVNGIRFSQGLKARGGEGSGPWRQRAALRMPHAVHAGGRLAAVSGAPPTACSCYCKIASTATLLVAHEGSCAAGQDLTVCTWAWPVVVSTATSVTQMAQPSSSPAAAQARTYLKGRTKGAAAEAGQWAWWVPKAQH